MSKATGARHHEHKSQWSMPVCHAAEAAGLAPASSLYPLPRSKFFDFRALDVEHLHVEVIFATILFFSQDQSTGDIGK
jgi:hypothetical protein